MTGQPIRDTRPKAGDCSDCSGRGRTVDDRGYVAPCRSCEGTGRAGVIPGAVEGIRLTPEGAEL